MLLLLSLRILTSIDDKDNNDIAEPECDDDRLFDKNLKFHWGIKGKNRQITLALLLSIRILPSTDHKGDNDITEPVGYKRPLKKIKGKKLSNCIGASFIN